MRPFEEIRKEIIEIAPAEELLRLTGWLAEKYTAGDSTSVSYERAEQLMNAVLYCLAEELEVGCRGEEAGDAGKDMALNTGRINGELTAAEKEIDWKKRYDSGYQRLIDRVKETKELYESILLEFDDYGNRTYRDTVLLGMPQFFLRYDPRFCPQEHLLMLDYPVFEDLQKRIKEK